MSEANKRRILRQGGVVLAACTVAGVAGSALAIHGGRPINNPIVPYLIYQLVAGFIAGILAPQWL